MQLFGVTAERVEHGHGWPVADLAAGDMTVLDGDDGVLHVGEIMHDDFAVRTELLGNAAGDLFQTGEELPVHHAIKTPSQFSKEKEAAPMQHGSGFPRAFSAIISLSPQEKQVFLFDQHRTMSS